MQNIIYADGIVNTQIIEGVVRFDLTKMIPAAEEKMTIETTSTIAMSLPAFLRAYDQLSIVMNTLVEKGLITKTSPQDIVSTNVTEAPKSSTSTALKDVLKKTQQVF